MVDNTNTNESNESVKTDSNEASVVTENTEASKDDNQPSKEVEVNNSTEEKTEVVEETSKEEAQVKQESDLLDATPEDAESTLDEDGYFKATGIPMIDSVISYLKDAKVKAEDADKIFEKAVGSLNIDDVDLASLEKAVGKDKAEIIKDKVELLFIKEQKGREDLKASINELSGGKWEEIKDWSNKNLSEDERRDYNNLILEGGLARKLAISTLSSKLGDNADPEAKLIKPQATSTAQDNYYLSAADYKQARMELSRVGNMLTPEAVKKSAELDKRRMYSINLESSRR